MDSNREKGCCEAEWPKKKITFGILSFFFPKYEKKIFLVKGMDIVLSKNCLILTKRYSSSLLIFINTYFQPYSNKGLLEKFKLPSLLVWPLKTISHVKRCTSLYCEWLHHTPPHPCSVPW